MKRFTRMIPFVMMLILLFSSMTVSAAPAITAKQNADYMMSVNADGVPNWFNGKYYSDKYVDLKTTFGNHEKLLYNHSLEYGFKEARLVTPVLDVVKYRASYPDLEKAFSDNWELYIKHYFEYGIAEGRNNFTDFDAGTYLNMYSDLQNEFGDDLGLAARHYIEFGIEAGRAYNLPEPEMVYEESDESDSNSTDNDLEDTTGGDNGSSDLEKVTASVEDTIMAVAGGPYSEPVLVALHGAAFKTFENITREEFTDLETQIREKLIVECPDGIVVNAYPLFAEEYFSTEWETKDVAFIIVVDALVNEGTEPGDYTFSVTISPDLLDVEEGYENASVKATGTITVTEPEVINQIYLEMMESPVFTTTQITDESGITGVEFSIDYDDLMAYTVSDIGTIEDVVNMSLEYESDGYCVWNENESGKNTSAEYVLYITLEPAAGYVFDTGIDQSDIKLCMGVDTGALTVTACDSHMMKMTLTFTVTAEDLENMANAQG